MKTTLRFALVAWMAAFVLSSPPLLALAPRPEVSCAPSDGELYDTGLLKEALVPLGRETTPADNQALRAALDAFRQAQAADLDDTRALETFLSEQPGSPWAAWVTIGLAYHYFETGYYTRCFEKWERAWELTKVLEDERGRLAGDGSPTWSGFWRTTASGTSPARPRPSSPSPTKACSR
jgi:hypothetical protein